MSNHQNILDKVRVRLPVKGQEDLLTEAVIGRCRQATRRCQGHGKDQVKADLRNGLRLSKFT